MSLDIRSEAILRLLAQHKGMASWCRRRDGLALCRLLTAANTEGRGFHAHLVGPPLDSLPCLLGTIYAARF